MRPFKLRWWIYQLLTAQEKEDQYFRWNESDKACRYHKLGVWIIERIVRYYGNE